MQIVQRAHPDNLIEGELYKVTFLRGGCVVSMYAHFVTMGLMYGGSKKKELYLIFEDYHDDYYDYLPWKGIVSIAGRAMH
jgi:hypothetical protein